MTLGGLLSGLTGVRFRGPQSALDVEVRGIAWDSRRVQPGDLFVAIRGLKSDGNRFAGRAAAAGAAAVASALRESERPPDAAGLPWIEVDEERTAMAALAARFHGYPSERLRLVGITGTNGKTTTTYLVESVLKAAGLDAAVFGTIEYRGPGFRYAAERTTPESPELQALLKATANAGCAHAVMEVSSQAIAFERVSALRFDTAVFTNLSRDHLDQHGDMRTYFLEKKKLFTGLDGRPPRVAVLNRDDAQYEELAAAGAGRVISYGIDKPADVRPRQFRFGNGGIEAEFDTPEGVVPLRSLLAGRTNLYNAAAAIGAALGLGLSTDAIREGIARLKNVPGRFEPVDCGQDFRVIVDYAHTDDALEKVLRAAREITPGRLIVVFGCGGDRDRTKRPLMGEAAAREADFAVVTADNPRGEAVEAIFDAIRPGFTKAGAEEGKAYAAIADRREAIRFAFGMAGREDTVVLAGKGHETTQVVGDRTFDFDDRVVACELIDERLRMQAR